MELELALVLVVVVSENCCMFLLETDISIIINQVSHDIDHTYVWRFHFHWQRLKNKVMSQVPSMSKNKLLEIVMLGCQF